jgi:hypothetical protein
MPSANGRGGIGGVQRRRKARLAKAVQPSSKATPPTGVTQPSQREQAAAKQHDPGGKAPSGDGGSTAPRLAALRQRDNRDQRRRMHHPVDRAGAQQFGGARLGGEMGRQRAGRDRGKPAEPGDRQPQPDHPRSALARSRSR